MERSCFMSDNKLQQRRIFRAIMLALAAWGAFLALGAFLFGYDPEIGGVTYAPNPLRGLIVLACAALFIGGWNLLLLRRK